MIGMCSKVFKTDRSRSPETMKLILGGKRQREHGIVIRIAADQLQQGAWGAMTSTSVRL